MNFRASFNTSTDLNSLSINNLALKQLNVNHWTYSDRGTRKPKHISNYGSVLNVFGVGAVGKYTNYFCLDVYQVLLKYLTIFHLLYGPGN